MNTELRRKAKNYSEKYFFKLINNAVFGKTIEKATKGRDIKFVKQRKYITSYQNQTIIQ